MKRLSWAESCACAAAGAMLAVGAWRLSRGAAPPQWDDAWYLETSFRLWSALKEGPAAFAWAYANALHIKAPLIALIPFPLYALLGPGENVALWMNLPLAALGAWAWSRAAERWWQGHPRASQAAAIGGALCVLTPMASALTRVFLVETLMSCLLGLLAWRCAVARAEDRREGARLGVLIGLGLLAKVTFPLFAAGFLWPARRRLKPHAKIAALIGVLISATWYAFNAPYVLGFAWSAGFGRVAGDYAGAGGLSARLDSVIALAREGFSWPLSVAAAAVAFAAAWSTREKPGAGLKTALWGLLPLPVFILSDNRELRLVAPLLPLFALLAGRSAAAFSRRSARVLAAAALLITGLWTCVDRARRVEEGPPWDRAALIDAVVAAAGPEAVAAIALEHRFLNANNLSSLAAARGLPLSFVSLGYAQSSSEAALIRLKEKNASVIVFVDGPAGADAPAFLNRANAGVEEAVRSGRLRARQVARVDLARGLSARVFRL